MAFGRAVRYSLLAKVGFCWLWQELLRRFATPTKPKLLLHKAAAAIPNAAGYKTRKLFLKKKLTKPGDFFKNVLTPHKPFGIHRLQLQNLKKKSISIKFCLYLTMFKNE
jgi:hypothetical protein